MFAGLINNIETDVKSNTSEIFSTKDTNNMKQEKIQDIRNNDINNKYNNKNKSAEKNKVNLP